MFEFMNDFIVRDDKKIQLNLYENGFFPISEDEIILAKKVLKLPSQLVEFYREVGVGRLQTGRNGQTADYNNLASPRELIEIMNGTSDWIVDDLPLEAGVLPFFQRGIGLLLCFHPKSENPNAVHWMWGEKISNSLVEFWERLIEDPNWFNPLVTEG